MRMMRSFFFGGLALLAAVMFLSAPARAVDYEPGVSAYSLDRPEIALNYDVAPSAILAKREDVPKPSMNAHAVAYASQNQPFTSWRYAVDAYSRIDPHI